MRRGMFRTLQIISMIYRLNRIMLDQIQYGSQCAMCTEERLYLLRVFRHDDACLSVGMMLQQIE